MTRTLLVLTLTAALVALPARGVAVQLSVGTDIAELTGAESGLDGQVVTVEGEVVSEMLAGGDGHVWINILADGVAIGVWAPEELTGDITVFGDWGHTGDRVVVTGVFSEACDTHGGDLDLHASDIALVERGMERSHPVVYWKLGAGLVGVTVAALGLRRMRRLEEGDPT